MATESSNKTGLGRQRGKMQDVNKENIRNNWTFLLKEIDANDLIDYMYEKKVFDFADMEEIKQIATHSRRTHKFFSKLLRAGPHAYDVFISALQRQGYKEAVTRLTAAHKKEEHVNIQRSGTESQRLSNMALSAKHELSTLESKPYAQTRAYKKAEELLDNLGIVVVIGSKGSGKTALSHHLMIHLMNSENRRPLFLTHHSQFEDIPMPEDFKNIKAENMFVILIDDMFGSNSLVTDFRDSWTPKLPTIWNHLQTGLYKLIVTFNAHIFHECKDNLTKFDVFKNCHQLDLSSPATCLDILKICLDDEDMKTAVQKTFDELGFPGCCRFYAKYPTAQARGVD